MTEGSLVPTEQGTPQGGVISPLLANIFLHQFDKKMTKRGYKVVRFADDFVIMTKSKRKAKRAYEVVKEIMEAELDLTLHPEKTVITNFGRGFEFLGFEFITWRYKRPKEKALEAFKNKVRKVTKRNQPWNIDFIIRELNPKIRGWGNYFGHGNVKGLFRRLDEWIRMRLRSYIEKKKAIYNQNKRIPNSYFRQKGLKSLLTTLSVPSSTRVLSPSHIFLISITGFISCLFQSFLLSFPSSYPLSAEKNLQSSNISEFFSFSSSISLRALGGSPLEARVTSNATGSSYILSTIKCSL